MHPAISIIFFTTASGAGYGLLTLLGIGAALGLIPPDPLLGLAALALALGLVGGGLLSSTAHLGRPERAWRAFSQWQSSWLSREGVASVLTFAPALLFAAGWVLLARTDGWVAAAGIISAAGAMGTVFITAMIYASLKPIRQWHSAYTAPGYLIYALMTGAILLNALLLAFGYPSRIFIAFAALAIALGWAWKTATWRHNDALEPATTLSAATGLPDAPMRIMEWPHTQENYLLKEMGFRVAQKHAVKLRRLVHLLAFGLPFAMTAAASVLTGPLALIASSIAVLAVVPGMLVERWLFFAEARHAVELYYRAPATAAA